MAKTKWFWVATMDTGTINRMQLDIDNNPGCKWLSAWSDIQSGDDLCISAHGSPTDPSNIFGHDDSTNTDYTVDYNWLADAVADGVGNSKLAFQIKLYICHSADRVKVGKERKCFAGQFMSAMKGKGYKKVKVAAYHGEMYLKQGGFMNKVCCTTKHNPNTLQFSDVKKFMGITYVDRKGYSAAKYQREWFTDNLFGTRWL